MDLVCQIISPNFKCLPKSWSNEASVLKRKEKTKKRSKYRDILPNMKILYTKFTLSEVEGLRDNMRDLCAIYGIIYIVCLPLFTQSPQKF